MQNKSKKHRKHIFKMILSECSVNKVKLGKTFAGDFLTYYPKHRSYLREKIYWFEMRKICRSNRGSKVWTHSRYDPRRI